LAAITFAAFLAGCACTAIGCDNHLQFVTGNDIVPYMPYTAVVCVDDACAEGSLTPANGLRALDGNFTLSVEQDTVGYVLDEGDLSGLHHVTFSLRDESGEVVGAFDDTIEFTKSEPNGGGTCGPTCWSAELDV